MSIPQLTPPTAAIAIPVFPVTMPASAASLTDVLLKHTDQPVSDSIGPRLLEAWMESEIQSLLAHDPDDDDDDFGRDDDFDDDDDEEDDFDSDDDDDDLDGDDDDFDEEEDDYADEDEDEDEFDEEE